MERSLAELAALVDGEVEGDTTVRVARLATIDEAGSGDLTFLANPRYRRFLATTRAGAVILGPGVACDRIPVIRCEDPYLAFALILRLFNPIERPPAGIDPAATVEAGAQIGDGSTLMAGSLVAAGARLGERVVLHPGCFVGREAEIGDDCYLYPNVVVREGVRIGARCILQPGAIIGSDGFGYAQTEEGALKIPQVGAVRMGDDVEIGANACIDRGALGDTVIGDGVKIDNLVQIAHNVHIGDHTIITAMVGVAGSTTIGAGCAIGGHSAIAGHIEIGDGVSLAAMSGVPGNLRGGRVYAGIPAQEHRAWRRVIATVPRLPEMRKEIESLRRRLAVLETGQDDNDTTEA